MTLFDYIVVAIMVGSVLLAMMRGLVSEVLSLGTWLVAFWSAKQFTYLAAAFLPLEAFSADMRLVLAFVVVFLGTWLACVLLRMSLTGMLDSTGLGGINRFFGAVFGLARGAVLVTALVVLGGLSDLPKQPAWKNALLSKSFESFALALRPWMPAILAEKLQFS